LATPSQQLKVGKPVHIGSELHIGSETLSYKSNHRTLMLPNFSRVRTVTLLLHKTG